MHCRNSMPEGRGQAAVDPLNPPCRQCRRPLAAAVNPAAATAGPLDRCQWLSARPLHAELQRLCCSRAPPKGPGGSCWRGLLHRITHYWTADDAGLSCQSGQLHPALTWNSPQQRLSSRPQHDAILLSCVPLLVGQFCRCSLGRPLLDC